MPSNPQCTFSPTALKHYLNYPSVTTYQLDSLQITTSSGTKVTFPLLQQQVNGQLLDYHRFWIVRPKPLYSHSSPIAAKVLCPPPVATAGSTIPLTRNLCHQRLCHSCDQSLDNACRYQSLLGLQRPFPIRQLPCPICTTTTFSHPSKTKEASTLLTRHGQLLHMDFSFWNVVSIRGFSSFLSIIDGKD
jgi:hypothetical protein